MFTYPKIFTPTRVGENYVFNKSYFSFFGMTKKACLFMFFTPKTFSIVILVLISSVTKFDYYNAYCMTNFIYENQIDNTYKPYKVYNEI